MFLWISIFDLQIQLLIENNKISRDIESLKEYIKKDKPSCVEITFEYNHHMVIVREKVAGHEYILGHIIEIEEI